MPQFKPMLAQDGTCADALDPTTIKQRKYDGTRTFIIKEGNKVRLMGARNWKNDYSKQHPELAAEARKIPVKQGVFDAELTYFIKGTNDDKFLTALAKKSTMEKEGVEPKLMIFDVLQINNAKVTNLPYKERDKLLETTIPKDLKLIEKVESSTDGKKMLKATANNEGIVVKDPECKYELNKRSKCLLKVKNWLSDEAIAIGYTQGKGAKAPTFGALVLAQYNKEGNLQYVGKASGFTQTGTKEMLEKLNKIKVPEKPENVVGVQDGVKAWVKPKVVVEVKYLERTNKGILRQPDYMRERTDKPLKDVTLKTNRQRMTACDIK